MIGRREFVGALGAAVAWPLAARAQQGVLPMVGILQAGPPGSLPQFDAPLRAGLGEVGYVEGRSVTLEYRYAQNELERLPELANDLVRRHAAVIVTLGSDAVAAAVKKATATTPIVFEIGGDPVAEGFAASLGRPGGNLTGVTSMNAELSAKRLGLIHDLAPQARRIATILSPSPASELIVKLLQAAASRIGVEVEFLRAQSGPEIETAFADLVGRRTDALVVSAGPPFSDHVAQIATLAARHALPAIYPTREAAEMGGLMSYSPNNDRLRQVGIYVGRILKGEKPADLPVQQATKLELVINLKTARTLGLAVSSDLLSIADEVIE